MKAFLNVMGIIIGIVPTSWALHMYGFQGDPLWFLTIICCPIMGWTIFTLGRDWPAA